MPRGSKVRPHLWSNVIDLYDDGECSAIWGRFDERTPRCLGIRWNGKGKDVGYPNLGGNPLWFVVPNQFAEMILLDIFAKVPKKPPERLSNIKTAVSECQKQGKSARAG